MRFQCAATLLTAAMLATASLSPLLGQREQASKPVAAKTETPLNAPLPPVSPPDRPVIGLALEGGGALGIAHIGILEWLEDNHIPVDRLAGTSMGALVGALYVSGQTPAQLRALASSDAFKAVFTLQTAYVDSSFAAARIAGRFPH